MKKISFIILSIVMITIFGCIDRDGRKIDKERVIKLDSIISELKKVEKRAIGDTVLDGIYIKTAVRTEAYLFNYLGELTFEQKVDLIKKMDGATAVYIVLSNRYVLWKNYVNLNGFSGAPDILSIIGLKTEVFNVKLNRVTYANGEELTTTVVVNPNSLKVFFIGNSVTDTINYGGLQEMAVSRDHTHTWARHMIPGAPLSWLWDHPNDGFLVEPYGTPTNAFSQYAWDAISLQPFDRNIIGDDGDVVMSNNYINIAKKKSPNVQIYIYQRWPRKPADFKNTADEWNTLWLSSYNIVSPGWSNVGQEARTYSEQLISELRKVHTDIKPCLMVPVGEVLYELNKKMALGQIPGYSNIWNLYADGIHMTNVGSFVVGATFYATMYKEEPRGISIPGTYGTIPVDIKNIILQTIWDVLRNYKDTTGKTWSGLSSDVTTIPVTGVAIDRTSLELSTTTLYTLTPTITPSNATNKEVRWSSGNTAVCTVDQTGRVTPVGSGNATITVTTVDGSRTAQCAVTVSVSNIAVTGITVAPTSATLIKGNTTTLNAVITPSNAMNKSLTWTSSAPSVATVNAAGVVTAIAKGSAVITATTVSAGLQAVCNITVTVPNTAPVAVISATPTTGIAPLTVQFSASGSRDNDSGDYVLGYDWEFGYNNGVASSVSPQYTYTVPGVYTVRLRVMDSNNLRGEWVTTTINVTSK